MQLVCIDESHYLFLTKGRVYDAKPHGDGFVVVRNNTGRWAGYPMGCFSSVVKQYLCLV